MTAKIRPIRPKRSTVLPEEYDPGKRLIAAVVLKAVEDHFYPPRDLTPAERQSAAEFLASEEACALIEYLNIPVGKVKQTLQLAA